MPNIWIDGILEIRPPKNCEILLGKIREVIIALKRMGLNIVWVTFDQFKLGQSANPPTTGTDYWAPEHYG